MGVSLVPLTWAFPQPSSFCALRLPPGPTFRLRLPLLFLTSSRKSSPVAALAWPTVPRGREPVYAASEYVFQLSSSTWRFRAWALDSNREKFESYVTLLKSLDLSDPSSVKREVERICHIGPCRGTNQIMHVSPQATTGDTQASSCDCADIMDVPAVQTGLPSIHGGGRTLTGGPFQ